MCVCLCVLTFLSSLTVSYQMTWFSTAVTEKIWKKYDDDEPQVITDASTWLKRQFIKRNIETIDKNSISDHVTVGLPFPLPRPRPRPRLGQSLAQWPLRPQPKHSLLLITTTTLMAAYRDMQKVRQNQADPILF